MNTTVGTPTKAAGIFKRGKTLFLHTATGRCVTFAAGCAAIFTAFSTRDAGLAAACAALFKPAVLGSLIGRASETEGRLGRLVNATTFCMAIVLATAFGFGTTARNSVDSLPEMKPDTPIVIKAKDYFCGSQTGWIKVQGRKLNCGN